MRERPLDDPQLGHASRTRARETICGAPFAGRAGGGNLDDEGEVRGAGKNLSPTGETVIRRNLLQRHDHCGRPRNARRPAPRSR